MKTEQEQIEDMAKAACAACGRDGYPCPILKKNRPCDASLKYAEAVVKQAKIDVLNELKDKMFEREYMGVKYKERIFYESEIDEFIEEIKNEQDTSNDTARG